MRRIKMARRRMVERVAPIVLVAVLGVAAGACGSGGGPSRVQNAPAHNAPAPPTTAAPSSGGAGF